MFVQQLVDNFRWQDKADDTVLQHVFINGNDNWEAVGLVVGRPGVLCSLRWRKVHVAALTAAKALACQSIKWTAWELSVLEKAGVVFQLAQLTKTEMCKVMSQYLPQRTWTALKQKYNTDINLTEWKHVPNNEIDIQELAAACDALRKQLMAWVTEEGLPSELKVQLQNHQQIALHISQTYKTTAQLFRALAQPKRTKTTVGGQVHTIRVHKVCNKAGQGQNKAANVPRRYEIPQAMPQMPAAAVSHNSPAAQAAAAAALSSHLLHMSGQAAVSGISTGGGAFLGNSAAATSPGVFWQHGVPVSRPLKISVPAAPSTPQVEYDMHARFQRLRSSSNDGSSSSSGGSGSCYITSGSSTPGSAGSGVTCFNGCQLQPSAGSSPVVWQQQQQQGVNALAAAGWHQSFMPGGLFVGGYPAAAAASPTTSAAALAAFNGMHNAAVLSAYNQQLQQQLQQKPTAAGRQPSRFGPLGFHSAAAAVGGGCLTDSLLAPAAAAAAGNATKKRTAAAVLPGPTDTGESVEPAAKKRCVQGTSGDAAAVTMKAMNAIHIRLQQLQQQQQLAPMMVDSQAEVAAAAAATPSRHYLQLGSRAPAAAVTKSPAIYVEDASDEVTLPDRNSLLLEAPAAVPVAAVLGSGDDGDDDDDVLPHITRLEADAAADVAPYWWEQLPPVPPEWWPQQQKAPASGRQQQQQQNPLKGTVEIQQQQQQPQMQISTSLQQHRQQQHYHYHHQQQQLAPTSVWQQQQLAVAQSATQQQSQQQQKSSPPAAAPSEHHQQLHCSPNAADSFSQQQQQQYASDNSAAAAADVDDILAILEQHPTEDDVMMSDYVISYSRWTEITDEDLGVLSEWLEM